jgi:hypothetical protein
MPRGAIHQAEALPQEHSLHVTISVNQRRTWADFLAAGGGRLGFRTLKLAAHYRLREPASHVGRLPGGR